MAMGTVEVGNRQIVFKLFYMGIAATHAVDIVPGPGFSQDTGFLGIAFLVGG